MPGTGVHMGVPATDAMIGRWILEQYRVTAKLGEGGMGAVYLADQPAIGRQAVIKVIHPWLSRDAGVANRFATEARAAARLQNPHIVSIYNYGRMPDGTLFLAMEHLAGRTLAQLLRAERRLDVTRAVGIATQVCEALSHAHARGVVHRDLKPSNVMLVARDRGPDFVKVLDFGIAKLDGGEGNAAGAMLGTPQYMSPEQLTGRPIDGSSDVYTLGVVLYEMLAGRPPFVADAALGYVQKHTQEPPMSLAHACPGVRVLPAVEACLMRALAKAPHQRPQTADLFADELWSALMATVDSSHVPMPRVRPPAPSRLVVAAAVALGVVTIGGGVLATYLARQTAPLADPAQGGSAPPMPAGAASEPAMPPVAVPAPEPEPAPEKAPEKAALRAKSVSELEAIFLTMPSPQGIAARREMLSQLEHATAGRPDADAFVANRLMQWIADFGESDEPIEIIDDAKAD